MKGEDCKLLDLELEAQNKKIIELIAELGRLGGETDVSLPELQLYSKHSLFPEELFTNSLNTHDKKSRSKYLILKDFLLAKKLEGCSNKTIRLYYDCLFNFTVKLNKPIGEITTQDIRSYLNIYNENHDVSNTTLDNMRRIFSSYFEWLHQEDYIDKNPVKKIKRIKVDKVVKKPFTDEEVEHLRDACNNIRDLALIDLLNSSGVRVSELCGLNRDDIDLTKREGVVFGKGAKERVIYFDAKTKIHLEHYLMRRLDDNPALFVSLRYPYRRLQKSGVEILLKEIGNRAGISDVYPHRFRRTLATNLIDKGVPIEQVQQILGHTKIDTTLIYAIVNQNNVKMNHGRFI